MEFIQTLKNGDLIPDSDSVFDTDAMVPFRKLCPICGNYSDSFKPFGTRIRDNAECAVCGSFERHRSVYLATLYLEPNAGHTLVVGAPAGVCNRLSKINFDNLSAKDLLKNNLLIDGKYDKIICFLQPNHNGSLISVFRTLKRCLKKEGKLFVHTPLKKIETGYIIADTPIELCEFRWLLESLGVKTKLFKNTDIFSAETIDLYGLLAEESIFVCESGNSDFLDRYNIPVFRMLNLAEAYYDGIGVRENEEMCGYWLREARNSSLKYFTDPTKNPLKTSRYPKNISSIVPLFKEIESLVQSLSNCLGKIPNFDDPLVNDCLYRMYSEGIFFNADSQKASRYEKSINPQTVCALEEPITLDYFCRIIYPVFAENAEKIVTNIAFIAESFMKGIAVTKNVDIAKDWMKLIYKFSPQFTLRYIEILTKLSCAES